MEQNNKSITTSTAEFNLEQLDIAAIIKASLAISEQLLPEKLSETLLKIIMQESGADKGSLLLERDGQLSVFAEATVNNGIKIETYNTLKAPDYNVLPESIVQYVKRTNEKLIINDVSIDKVYSTDKYIIANHPKSIACLPIISENKNLGIVYLENSLFEGVFTPEKIVVLKILVTQASISFENANLFNTLDLSKKRFQDIMDNSSAVIFAKLSDGRYLFINKEFEKLYKVDRTKVINVTDFDIFPKEFAEAFTARDKIIFQTEKAITYEEKIPHEDGMHTYIIAKFPLRDSAGKFYAIAGIATDVSGLKRIEETLRENQIRFNFVLAATQDAIYDWDLVTGRIWRNEQYEKLFNGPSGPNFEWWKHNIHPDEFKDVAARLEEAIARHDQLWNQEFRFKRVKEGYAYVIDRGFIIYDNQGKAIRMIGALMDISERKQAVDDLERSLALSKATLESTTDGILVVDSNNKIVDYNKKFVEMWKLPPPVLETKDDDQYIGFILAQLKDSDNFTSKVKELMKTPEAESVDILEFNDGKVFERCSKPQKTKTNIIGRVWSFRDITDRVKTDDAEKKRVIKIIERQSQLLKLNKLLGNLPIKEKFKKIIETDAKTLEVERVSIQFFDAKKTTITSENTYLLSKAEYGLGVTFSRKDFPRYFSELEYNKIIDANNAEYDPRTSELADKYLNVYGITSVLNVPIRLKGNIVGVICHEHVGLKREWTYEEMVFVNSVADTVSLTLETDEREKTESELKLLNESLEERVKSRTSELSKSEEKFRAVVETANDAIISFDKTWKMFFWNKAAEKLFGYTPEEAIGKPIDIIIPANYLEKLKKSFENYLVTGEATIIGKGPVILNGLTKSGTEFPGELTIDAWKSNNEEFFTCIIKNISERKKIEQDLIKIAEQLLDSEERFRAVAETAFDSIISADKEGKIIFWNKAAEKMFGYTSQEAMGRFISIIVPPNKLADEKNVFENYLQPKKDSIIGKGNIQMIGLKKGGIEFPIEMSLESWKSNNEKFFTAIIRENIINKSVEKVLDITKEPIAQVAKEADVKSEEKKPETSNNEKPNIEEVKNKLEDLKSEIESKSVPTIDKPLK